MKRVAVKFNQPDQIIDFVRIMNRYEYDVDVKCGSRIVDAKSIVGVICTKESRAQKESESEMWSLSKCLFTQMNPVKI